MIIRSSAQTSQAQTSRLLRGRLFSSLDQSQAPPVAVIDDVMARTLWPNENPIGQHFRYTEDTNQLDITIVGVVVEAHSVFDAIIPPSTHFQIYRPWTQAPTSWMIIGLRCSGPPEPLENTLRNTIFHLDPALPISNIWPLRLEIDTAVGEEVGIVAKILGAFSAAGLFLAAVGVYGVITTFVVQRTPEIGIRMALGASARHVAQLVVGRTLALSAAGAAVGVLGAMATLSGLRSVWPAVEGSTGTLVAGMIILMTTSVIAACVPVRRAIRVDPMVALRAE